MNLAHMYLNGLGPALEDTDRFKKAFRLFRIGAYKTNNKNAEVFATINLAEMYLFGLGPAVEDPDRIKKAYNLLLNIKEKRTLSTEQAMADAYLAEMSWFGIVPESDREFRLKEAYDLLSLNAVFYLMNQCQKPISGHLYLTLFGIMHLDAYEPLANDPNRLDNAFKYLDFASKQNDNLRAQHLAEVRLAEMYLNNLGPAANDPDRLKKAFDLLDNASKKTNHPRALHRAQTLLAKMHYLNLKWVSIGEEGGEYENNDEYRKTIEMFKIAADKENDLGAQHIAQTYLALMYENYDGNADDWDDEYIKAWGLYRIASEKTNDPIAQHIAQTNLAVMTYVSIDIDLDDEDYEDINKDKLQEAFDLLTLAAYKTDDLKSQHRAQTYLGMMYFNGRGPTLEDPDGLEKAFELFYSALNKKDDEPLRRLANKELTKLLPLLTNKNNNPQMAKMQLGLVSMYFNGKAPLLKFETAINLFVVALKNPCMADLNCDRMIQNLLLVICKHSDHKSTLEIIFKRHIAEEPTNMGLKLIAYLIFGGSFQEEYNQFIMYRWIAMNYNEKLTCCQCMINRLGAENPRLQELLILLAQEGSNQNYAVSIYADLLVKLKDTYTHNPSISALKVEGENEQILHFAINPAIFDYLPISQDALASLDDVDFILGEDVDPKLKEIRNNPDFKKYFEAPFSEESMMIQAMIKKFKKMGENGTKKLAFLMHDMAQCSQGKNQAIWDHYSIESKPLCFANLKNITDWLARLLTVDVDLLSFGKSKNQIAVIVREMLKSNHVFRGHLTDLKTEEGQLLKALLGSVVELEKNDRIDLKETLKLSLNILVKLSNPEDFNKNLSELCEIHEIYLPANKFGDQLSSVAIEGLIQKLKPSDIDGLGEFLPLQEEMRTFANSEDFQSLLHNFEIEEGDQLRELMRGYVSNGWSVGFFETNDISKRKQP